MSDTEIFLLVLGLSGCVAYGVSGGMIAIENGLDAFGVLVLAVVTACGGGLLRDVMLSSLPGFGGFAVFTNWWYPLVSALSALIVFIVMWFLRNRSFEDSRIYRTLLCVIDALGLGAYAVIGADCAASYGITAAAEIIFYSVLTCVGGGVLRDLLLSRIPVIFCKHIYAVAAIAGAVLYCLTLRAGLSQSIAAVITVLLVMVIRILAFRYRWNFPRIRLKGDPKQ